ncbi:MAG: exodeoxyribonuclease VII large subunit, partial [Tabrizicola sp.]|uniref:exodeoxyribonuclease VII large subunit n=1 Tax=Tabrizicola sp. TaxID=2005166 RepID=UPI0027369979
IAAADRRVQDGNRELAAKGARLDAAAGARLKRLTDRLEALDRTRGTLGYAETLKRGYAVVRGDGHVVTTRAAAEKAASLEVEFADGRLALGARAPRKAKGEEGGGQGSLF